MCSARTSSRPSMRSVLQRRLAAVGRRRVWSMPRWSLLYGRHWSARGKHARCESSCSMRPRCDADGLVQVHRDAAPLALTEADHAQRATSGVTKEDGEPDVDGVEAAERLQRVADAERHYDL